MTWGQAGGSLRAESAGVWWSSMPLEERIRYVGFIENQQYIESGWDKKFGDRKNEIVFIGQDMVEELIKSDLDSCLSTEEELATNFWVDGYNDHWPIERFSYIS